MFDAAVKLAKEEDATLVIAKLDRLSRNMHVITSLMESKVRFVACDMPELDEFSIHIIAAVNERERKLISKRTKEALQAAKARGGAARQSRCCQDLSLRRQVQPGQGASACATHLSDHQAHTGKRHRQLSRDRCTT